MTPATQPTKKARFGESPNHAQKSAAAPIGASTATFSLGKARAIAAAPAQATAKATHEEIMPLRRVSSIVLMVALLFTLPACGRQITPSPVTSNLDGDMVIHFRTNGSMDFVNYTYAIVFDTCAPGSEPYPNANNTTYTSYSFAWAIGGLYAGSTITPALFQYILVSGSQTQLNPVRVTSLNPSTTTLVLNDNGSNTEFNLTFPLTLLENPLQQATPCPVPEAFTTSWYINFFTIDSSDRIQDSLGQFANTDTSYQLLINTTVAQQTQVVRPAGIVGLPSNPAAQIEGGEIDVYCPCL